MERDQQGTGSEAAEDAAADLDMKDEDADEVRGGAMMKESRTGSDPDAQPYK